MIDTKDLVIVRHSHIFTAPPYVFSFDYNNHQMGQEGTW